MSTTLIILGAVIVFLMMKTGTPPFVALMMALTGYLVLRFF